MRLPWKSPYDGLLQFGVQAKLLSSRLVLGLCGRDPGEAMLRRCEGSYLYFQRLDVYQPGPLLSLASQLRFCYQCVASNRLHKPRTEASMKGTILAIE